MVTFQDCNLSAEGSSSAHTPDSETPNPEISSPAILEQNTFTSSSIEGFRLPEKKPGSSDELSTGFGGHSRFNGATGSKQTIVVEEGGAKAEALAGKILILRNNLSIRDLAQNLRRTTSAFIRDNLREQAKLGFQAEVTESVSVKDFRAILEETYIHLQTMELPKGYNLPVEIDCSPLEQQLAESINGLLMKFRSDEQWDLVQESAQGALFVRMKEFRATCAAIVQNFDNVVAKIANGQFASEGVVEDEAAATDLTGAEYQVQLAQQQTLQRAFEVLAGDEPPVREVALNVRTVATQFLIDCHGQDPTPLGFGVKKQDDDRTSISTDELKDILIEASATLEDIFDDDRDRTWIGIQYRTFAQNLQSEVDGLLIALMREHGEGGISDKGLAAVMNDVTNCQSIATSMAQDINLFHVELQAHTPHPAA
ncbi:hypothetical protein OAO01_00820 [Oligoflexia bacterium]|nr:hypothetical protein [Oligoflexia bacterium]